MIKKLKHYLSRISELRDKIQGKLDDMDVTEYNEDVTDRREEQVELLDEIEQLFAEVIELIEDYNASYKRGGLKSIK